MLFVDNGEGQKFVDKLADGVATVARAIQPKPVVVRLSDFKTNEYRGLKRRRKIRNHRRKPNVGLERMQPLHKQMVHPSLPTGMPSNQEMPQRMGTQKRLRHATHG